MRPRHLPASACSGCSLISGTAIKTGSEVEIVVPIELAAFPESDQLGSSQHLNTLSRPVAVAGSEFEPSATFCVIRVFSTRGRRGRVELIHRLVTPSNLNSRDENDGIERRPDRFD